METKEYNENLPESTKMSLLMKAKGSTWYDGWVPYCVHYVKKCSSPRMIRETYGFRCPDCGNLLGFNLERLKESPLNQII